MQVNKHKIGSCVYKKHENNLLQQNSEYYSAVSSLN